jgi:hypothetical protein
MTWMTNSAPTGNPMGAVATRRPKMICISCGRPMSRLSAHNDSKNPRAWRGASKTMVREISTWRIEMSHQYPAARSASVSGSGNRAHQRSQNTRMAPAPGVSRRLR